MNPGATPAIPPFLLEAIVGAAIGAFLAVLASWWGKRATKFFQDVLLGAAGYLAGVAITPRIPWHQNTITYRMGDAVIRTTSRHFQYPYRVGFLMAVLFPLVYETIRFFVERKKKGV